MGKRKPEGKSKAKAKAAPVEQVPEEAPEQGKTKFSTNDVLKALYLAASDEAALEQLRSMVASKAVLKVARKELLTAGKSTLLLEQYCWDDRGIDLTAGRRFGMGRPVDGDVRDYTIQRLGNGMRYFRCPLDNITDAESKKVRVSFEQGTIVVTAV